MVDIGGTFEPRFEPVRYALAANLESGADIGASSAVVLDGELVVDIWGGHVDEARAQPWQRDTIINVWSTTKTMTALCALVLADRGELDFSAPVARYWPEFKAGGKDGVEVRHLMSHTSGLSGWAKPIKPDDLYDWERCTSLLAAQEPWWEPGTASGYHALTQGYLVGEVVRRVAGTTIGDFFAQEIAGPLGADFHIGTGEAHDARVARVVPPSAPLGEGTNPASVAARTLVNPTIRAAQSWETAWRRAEIPAANGHGNARSVALVQGVVACGGGSLLSSRGVAAIFEEQSHGTDLVLGAPLRFGIGYGLTSAELPIGPNPRACFWGGWGGSLCVVDLDARLCVAYVMNKMGEGTLGDARGASIAMAAYAALG